MTQPDPNSQKMAALPSGLEPLNSLIKGSCDSFGSSESGGLRGSTSYGKYSSSLDSWTRRHSLSHSYPYGVDCGFGM